MSLSKENTLGILGGGQLGRMLTLSARSMGYDSLVLDKVPNSPAAQVGAEQITADLKDPAGTRAVVERSAVTTYEIEHLNADILIDLGELGHNISPSPETLALINDKLKQHKFLKSVGIPTADFLQVENSEDAFDAGFNFSYPFLLKSRFGGFDGRGNEVVEDYSQTKFKLDSFKGAPVYAEKMVHFEKELAVVVARGKSGEVAAYPVVETRHIRNIRDVVLAPAPIDSRTSDQASEIANGVMKQFKGEGVFAIEMFLTEDGEVLVNEIAPRVHNSGHFTIEACNTSQFEQHVRAVMGLKLGDPSMKVGAAAMINILGEIPKGEERKANPTILSNPPEAAFHIYGKENVRSDRKMGHITVVADNLDEALKNARAARAAISI